MSMIVNKMSLNNKKLNKKQQQKAKKTPQNNIISQINLGFGFRKSTFCFSDFIYLCE
jgi:hypothetical protein